MQPESGGYLEAVPLTAFVVMSLVSCGMLNHPVVTKGLRFILNTVRSSGAWAIDTNLATWLTSQSFVALHHENSSGNENDKDNKTKDNQDKDQDENNKKSSVGADQSLNDLLTESLNYIVANQHTKKHPFTGALPGGWAWTNLSGGVPDADDTAGALLALAASREDHTDIAVRGIRWLLAMQNRNGGMPTFCRGWGMLPFDQSSTDITAHTIRAFRAWLPKLQCGGKFETLIRKMQSSEKTMLQFLKRTQKADGSWVPLWFGDQFHAKNENPVYGTAKVLTALAVLPKDTMPQQDETATRAVNYLLRLQNEDAGWGTKKHLNHHSVSHKAAATSDEVMSTIEETAVVLEALAPFAESTKAKIFIEKGLTFLLDKVETGTFTAPAPIGLYFSKLWYYENLYPILFTTSALRQYLQ
jgi:squalene-hopene/tetraprenyl-beta-curcumene cyclase